MVSKLKLYSRLDDLEAELVERLVPHLEEAASGKNDLVFCVKGYHTFRELDSRSDRLTEGFILIGSDILSLKVKRGEPSEGSVAERILLVLP